MSIRSAIESHLAAWVNAQTPKPPVAWENPAAVFTPPPNASLTYLRTFRLPAARRGMTLCSIEEAGVYQVTICYGKPGGTVPGGAGPAEALAESLMDHFKPGKYAGFFVSQPPFHSRGEASADGRWNVPVSIFYRAEP